MGFGVEALNEVFPCQLSVKRTIVPNKPNIPFGALYFNSVLC